MDRIDAAGCRGVELDVSFPVGQGKATGWDEAHAEEIYRACPVLEACRAWSSRIAVLPSGRLSLCLPS